MAALVALVLAALLLIAAGCGRSRESATGPAPLAPSPPAGRLQEVAPPAAVQQLQAALADRDPRLTIELPADGATLPAGPWTLRLRVRDWPLVNAGSLGLGGHLAVQIDDQPVLRLTDHRNTAAGTVVETELPALAPGSHRITAYAARPWGEAVKSPGAATRIRVQSVVGNPLTLPAPGTPELVAVSPAELTSTEPVLLDWLLFDAPLQHLRDGDGSWRLRVSVNGDAFLLDQNAPLWLRGWNNGSNALLLELVDGQGAPLNPPFNSLVRELNLDGGSKPRWLAGPLEPEELAVLLGEIPPPATAPDTQPAPEPTPESEPSPAPAPEPAAATEPAEMEAQPSAGVPEPPEAGAISADAAGADAADPGPANRDPGLANQEDGQLAEPPVAVAAGDESTRPQAPAAPAPESTPPAPTTITNPERVAPSTSLAGSARQQVAADGTLIQPSPRGPLAGLRQRLGGS
ncbi:MAG: hypothetical protein VKM97_00675 [Cyanobacteriota bacterium]|nr:hypothetical protein [Cyanobacteriota bacterium]